MSWNLIILGFNCQRDSRALGRRGLDKNTGRSEGRKFLEESALRTVNRINFCSAGGRRVARRGRLDVITRASLIQTYSGDRGWLTTSVSYFVSAARGVRGKILLQSQVRGRRDFLDSAALSGCNLNIA